MNQRVIFFLFFIYSFVFSIHAQDPFSIQFSITDGLPSNEVYDIEIDSLQQIWISTDRGVCKYDGYKFTTYTTKDGLSDNTNFEIYKDSKNQLWFSGYNQTLSYYKAGKFSSYVYNDTLKSILDLYSGKWVNEIYENSKGDYFFTFLGASEAIIYKFREQKIPTKIDYQIINDSLNNLSKSGRNFFTLSQIPISFFKTSKKTIFPIQTQIAIPYHNFWIYKQGKYVCKRNKLTGKIERAKVPNDIEYLYVDQLENIWVCTGKGVLRFENLSLSRPPKHFFNEVPISSIIQDLEGNYWLGSNTSGLLLVPSFDIGIVHNNIHKINQETFLSIGKLKNYLVFGTSNQNLFVVDKELKKEVIPINSRSKGVHIKKLEPIPFTNQLSLSNNLLLKEGSNEVILVDQSQESYFGDYQIYLSNGDTMHIVSPGFKIFKTDQSPVLISKEFEIPFSKNLTSVTEGNDNTIWLGSLNGLFKINDNDYLNSQEVLYLGKPFNRISDIKIDSINNGVWVSTIGDGLFFISENNIFKINTEDGLSSNMVNQLLLHGDSTLWIATNKGVNVFNYSYQNGTFYYSFFKYLNTSDGLNSNYINDIDYWNGKIWLATNTGICYLSERELDRKLPLVNTFINQFTVADSNYSVNNNVHLKYNENDIFIEYTGVSFRKGKEDLLYQYRLINHEIEPFPKWFRTKDKRIRYNDLSSGNYSFEVTAQNKLGEWNRNTTKLNFVINPHFTETKLFRFTSIFLLVFVFGLIGVIQVRRIRIKQQRQLQLKEAQLKSQEAELALLRNQMNPHFVFNSLNSIQNFIFRNDKEKANYYLSKFSELMRDSLQYTRLDYISLQEEVDFLENYLELEAMRFPDRFLYEFIIPDEMDIDYLLIPSLLLQPILENSVKHAFNGIEYKGIIKVKFELNQEDLLIVNLTDNGKGKTTLSNHPANQKNRHQPLGLEILKNRIDLLNKSNSNELATIEFTNGFDQGKGFMVQIKLPIRYRK